MEELFMKQPIGLKDGTGWVCRLVKSIYGPKQVGNISLESSDSARTGPELHHVLSCDIACSPCSAV
jgi:hypothetical protein